MLPTDLAEKLDLYERVRKDCKELAKKDRYRRKRIIFPLNVSKLII